MTFAPILRGLMTNRRLDARTLSRACGRAQSTINQLMTGAVAPTPELLRDLAPPLQLPVADLLVIAGLPVEPPPAGGAFAAAQEIGALIAAATWLTPDQVNLLLAQAAAFRRDTTPGPA